MYNSHLFIYLYIIIILLQLQKYMYSITFMLSIVVSLFILFIKFYTTALIILGKKNTVILIYRAITRSFWPILPNA